MNRMMLGLAATAALAAGSLTAAATDEDENSPTRAGDGNPLLETDSRASDLTPTATPELPATATPAPEPTIEAEGQPRPQGNNDDNGDKGKNRRDRGEPEGDDDDDEDDGDDD